MVNAKSKKGRQQRKAADRANARKTPKNVVNRSRTRRPRNLPVNHLIKHGCDAFNETHIPLPISVSPYHVIRTRAILQTAAEVHVLGTMRLITADRWSNLIGFNQASSLTTLNSALLGNMVVPLDTTLQESGAEMVPAAVSFRIRCTDPLLNASGVTYIGRFKSTLSQPDGADTRTFQALFDSAMSFLPYRACTNAELVTHGKQVNLIPSNTTEIQHFMPCNITPTTDWSGGDRNFAGFNPIFIYNPTAANLEIEACIEWRVRLSPFNPMQSAARPHAPTPDTVWHTITQAANSGSHGVEDIISAGAGYALAAAGGTTGIMSSLLEAGSSLLPALETLAPLAIAL